MVEDDSGTGPRASANEAEEPRLTARSLLALTAPDANPSRLIYGIITVGTLLAAESAEIETYWRLVGGVALALLIYWAADAYTVMAGEAVSGRAHWSPKAVTVILGHEAPVLWGGFGPLVALCLAWAAGAPISAGGRIALWTAVGSLVVWEIFAGVRSGLKPRALMFEAFTGAVLGSALLGLRLVLH